MYQIADTFCCAGLSSDGLAAVFGAGAIHGYDIDPQPNYPYDFTQDDVMKLLEQGLSPLEVYAALWLSPPCQEFTTGGHLRKGKPRFGDLLTPALALLRERWAHKPWIVENVDDNRKRVRTIMAPQPGESLVILCGSMFGLQVQRHRVFLANFPIRQPESTGRGVYGALGCRHDTFPVDPRSGKPRPWGVSYIPNDEVPSGGHSALDAEHGRQVMGVYRTLPWDELKQGVPPAFASWLGADLLAHLKNRDHLL